jgi:hypothetical protein
MHLKLQNLRLLDKRQILALLVVVLIFCALLSGLYSHQGVEAATASTINFQARLMNNSGSIAPDGNYNVEFKLYNASSSSGSSQGSCSGDANCVWTETRTGSDKITVANGYVTVNLGSVTSFGSTINWDQEHWLTMNIGGTGGSPSWDGEMSPRLKLTAVPYAFKAGQLAQFNSSTGFTSTLNIAQPTGGNQTFIIPDQGAAGTYNVLTTATAATSFVQLQATTPGTAQTGNFNISGTGIATTALQSASIDSPSGTTTLNVGTTNATTAVNLGSSSVATVSLQASTTLNLGNNGNNKTINIGATGSTANTTTVNLATSTGAAQTVNIGSTNGASALTLRVGTGNFSLDGAAGSTYTLGASTTTGTITIGGTAQTGNIDIGTGTGVESLNFGTGGTGAKTVTVGSTASTGTTLVQSGTGGTSVQSAATGAISIGTTNNNAITTGTGLLTQGGNITFSGTAARTITGPATGGLTLDVTTGPLTLSTTTSGTLAVTSAGALDLTGAANSTFGFGVNSLGVTSSNFNVSTGGVLNVVGGSAGFQIGGAAASGNYLRGNGTSFVSSAIQAGDIPDLGTLYIKNQTSQQASSDFNISGTGVAGVALQAPLFQTADGAGASTAVAFRSGNTTGGSGLSTGAVTIKSGDGSGTNTSSGNLTIDSGATTGSGTAGTIGIGTTNASSLTLGHTGVTTTNSGALSVSQLLSANGGLTVAANQNVTLSSGTGTYSQTYSNTTGTAATFAATDSASSGTTTVQGVAINLTGTNNASGSNTITGLNFGNVAAATNNTYYGLNFGTGFNDLLRYNGTQLISGAGKVQDAAIDSSVTYSNLQKVGTINTGTWQGTTVGVAYGGTGQTTYTDGQLLIGNSSGNTLTKATLTGTANRLGVTNGNGSITLDVDATQFPSSTGGNVNYVLRASGANAASWVSNTQANVCSDCATRALDNLASVAINTALGFQSNQTANINFAAAAAAGGNLLSITGQTAGATANNGGAVTVQGGTGTTTGAGGLLSLLGGVPAGASGTNGGVTIDTGNVAGAAVGAINIGTSNFAHNINIGNTGATGTQAIVMGGNGNTANTIDIDAGTGATGIEIGNTNTAHGIQIGSNATGDNDILLGGANAGSTLTLEAGTAASAIQIGNGATAHGIQIGTGAAVQTVAIGSTNGSSSTTIQGGSNNITLSTSTGNKVQVGSSASDSNVTLFGLDSYDNASDPTGFAGAMYYNSNAGVLAFRCYQNGAWTNCVNTTAGISTIGTIDTPTTSADGAHISGSTLYLQTATASVPGLVSTASQTFAGDKTFTGNIIVQGTTGLTFNTGAGGDITFANGEKIDNDTDAQINLQANGGAALTLLLTGTAASITNSAGTLTLNSSNSILTVDSSDTTLSATGLTAVNLGATTSFSTGGTSRLMLDGSNNLYFGNANSSGVAASPNAFMLRGTGSSTAATAGALLTVIGGTGNTSGLGGGVTIQGGTGGNTATGGAVTIQGGTAGGGNTNGANVVLTGGTGAGTGVLGLVSLAPTMFVSSGSTQTFNGGSGCPSCSVTGVDSYSSVAINAAVASLSINIPVPNAGNQVVGRILYVTAVSGSNDFTIVLGGTSISIAMKANSTATLIWNGTGWTAAGASSSTDLQSAYNNTLTSAGGAELLLNAPGGNADGLTIRNNGTTPIVGSLLEVQTSIGSNLLSVNNNATEYANNGGAESSTFTMWTGAPAGGTVARNTTATNVATGQASAQVTTSTSAAYGIENTLSTTLTNALKYQVSFAIKADAAYSSFSTLDVVYSYDGSNVRHCVAGTPYYSTGTASQSGTTITGSGTTFTSAMVGMTFVFADGRSTVISAYTSATQLTAATSQTVSSQNYGIYTAGFSVKSSVWSRVTCTFIAPASGTTITSSNSVMIRQTDTTTRIYYVDNLSITVSADVNHANDGSVDDSANFSTYWSAFDGDGGGSGTSSVARDTSVIYDTSASARADVNNTGDMGIRNNMAITPAASTQYLVSFYARSATGAINDLTVRYSEDGGTSFVSCVDYSTQAIVTSAWTKITCLFTADSSVPGSPDPDLVITQATAPGGSRSIYVDALSITLNNNNSSNVQVGGANKGGPTTLFTLDRSANTPIAANNDAYLGSMYYDTTSGRIQCYEADGWGACGAAPDNIVNLNPEYAGAVLNGTGIGTMTADLCSNDTALSINSTLCSTGQAKNFYKWTSPQSNMQTYSIYVSYQLPSTFNGFASDDTIQLVARTDSTTNAAVTYQVYKSTGSAVTQCWDNSTSETTVVTSANTWQSVGINGNEATGCGFNSSAAGNFVIFKINLKAKSNANAYVSTLSFTTTGR